jgi:outer membrane lipoprotein-sorting protein
MKQYFTFTIGLVFGMCSLFGQPDAQSKSILKKSELHYKAFKTISADFTLTTTGEGRKSLSNKGKLFIRGNKFKLDYADQSIYCDGKSIWSYNPVDEEVTLETYKKKTNDLSPQDMFNLYNRNYKSSFEGTVKAGKEMQHVIKLVPKKKKEKFAYVKVHIDSKTNELKKVIQHFKNGSEVIVTVTQMMPNKPLADGFFVWQASEHKGAVLVDLR